MYDEEKKKSAFKRWYDNNRERNQILYYVNHEKRLEDAKRYREKHKDEINRRAKERRRMAKEGIYQPKKHNKVSVELIKEYEKKHNVKAEYKPKHSNKTAHKKPKAVEPVKALSNKTQKKLNIIPNKKPEMVVFKDIFEIWVETGYAGKGNKGYIYGRCVAYAEKHPNSTPDFIYDYIKKNKRFYDK